MEGADLFGNQHLSIFYHFTYHVWSNDLKIHLYKEKKRTLKEFFYLNRFKILEIYDTGS